MHENTYANIYTHTLLVLLLWRTPEYVINLELPSLAFGTDRTLARLLPFRGLGGPSEQASPTATSPLQSYLCP